MHTFSYKNILDGIIESTRGLITKLNFYHALVWKRHVIIIFDYFYRYWKIDFKNTFQIFVLQISVFTKFSYNWKINISMVLNSDKIYIVQSEDVNLINPIFP